MLIVAAYAWFIPAYAGNICGRKRKCLFGTVHPRVRGEHIISKLFPTCGCGSSPRTRGTLNSASCGVRSYRFIPAYAGNIRMTARPIIHFPVHPRVRGEHNKRIFLMQPVGGSSPRTRGTLLWHKAKDYPERFIPAYAGNMILPASASCERPVHPRVRGEHAIVAKSFLTERGSSPRTRGTYQRGMPRQSLDRFIPAYAGNIGHCRLWEKLWPVHPRVRGEHSLIHNSSKGLAGSSPRTRGT